MLNIGLKYQLGRETWHEKYIHPQDYFWSDPDSSNNGKFYEVTDEPFHNNPSELIPISKRYQLSNIVTDVTHTISKERFRCAYSYWKSTENYVCLTAYWLKGVLSQELVLCGDIPIKPEGNQIIRITLKDEFAELTMNWVGWGKNGDEFGVNIKDSTNSV